MGTPILQWALSSNGHASLAMGAPLCIHAVLCMVQVGNGCTGSEHGVCGPLSARLKYDADFLASHALVSPSTIKQVTLAL